jgi:kynurenine formamidase
LQGCDFILLETGWSRFWETPAYFNDYPVLTPEAAHLLADCRPKGIGLDTISVDGIQEPGLPNHKIFLGQDTVIIENLTRLDRLPQEPFQFYCFPLKFKDSDGSPIRAVAVFNS